VVSLGTVVAEAHQIPNDGKDIIAITRPDIVYTNGINVPRIASVMAEVEHVIMPPHNGLTFTLNDPSELLVVGPRRFWEAIYITNSTCKPAAASLPRWNVYTGACVPADSCGFAAPDYIYAATALAVKPFFYFQPLGLNILRINGDHQHLLPTGITSSLPTPNSRVRRPALDLTKTVKCAVGESSACTISGRPKGLDSSCWGGTTRVPISPEGGLWVCDHISDVQKPGCTDTPPPEPTPKPLQ